MCDKYEQCNNRLELIRDTEGVRVCVMYIPIARSHIVTILFTYERDR